MGVQDSYSTTHEAAYAGQVDGQLKNVISKLNKGSAVIPYGKGVVSDGADGAQLPQSSSTAAQFNGVVKYELNRAQADNAGDNAGAVAGQDFSVVTTGAIYVRAAEAVAKDDPVFLRVGATRNGDFANDASAGATLGVQVPNAKFLDAATNAGDLVRISLNLGG